VASIASRPRALGRRRGAALAVVLIALVVTAGLATGAVFAARQARRSARDELAQLRASAGAEGALVSALHPWDRRRAQLASGGVDTTMLGAIAGATATVRALRLDAERFLVEASARARASQPGVGAWAERTASVVVRLHRATPAALGAVTAASAVELLDGATVDGRDAPPSGWSDCPASANDSVAIAAASITDVHVARGASVSGAVAQSAVAADARTYDTFGAERWADLARRADVAIDAAIDSSARTPRPRAAAGRCVLDADAWGDPVHDASGVAECATTYALVVVRGNLTVRGPARGQGVLLVDGDLTLDGDLTFAGVVIVRGGVRAQRGALHLDGALLVAAPTSLGSGTEVHRSRCALARALDGIAPVAPIGRRAWAEVTR